MSGRMDPTSVSILESIIKAQKKLQKDKEKTDEQKTTASRRKVIAPVSKKYAYFVSSLLLLGIFSYTMAYFVMDDAMRYERGVGRTIPRVKVAAGILGVYVPWLAIYTFASDSVTDELGLDILIDIAQTVSFIVLLNFILTTASYVLTWYWTYIDFSKPDEAFDLKDVVDMRKVRMSVKHSNPCSMAEFEGDEFALRDYGTLQTIPLGTGTLPTENVAGKLSWLIDVTFAKNKEELEFGDDTIAGWVWWGFNGLVGTIAAPFKFILQQIPSLNTFVGILPTLFIGFSTYYFKSMESMESGMKYYGQSMFGGILRVLLKFTVFMFLGFMMTSATTGSDIVSTITDPKGSACFGGMLGKTMGTLLFAMPDSIFKTAVKSASPKPNVFPDFSYYSDTMTFLRKNGFCTPYAWRTYLRYVWSKGEIPEPIEDDEEMDKLIDEMEESSLAWPSTVARTALMHAYNKKKFDDNKGDKKAWLDQGRSSVVLRHINSFAPLYRKSEVSTVLSPEFYKNPQNFREFKGDTSGDQEDIIAESNQRMFMRYRREYVRDMLKRAINMFSYDNVRKDFVNFKKLGFDSSTLAFGHNSKTGTDDNIVDLMYVRDAIWAFDEEDEEDTKKEFKSGQHRMESIIPFLSSTGSRMDSRLGIEGYKGISGEYCGSVFPGPPALVEDRQYRLNGYNGLFTILPVWEGTNKYGSKTTWEYIKNLDWATWPDPYLNELEWDPRSGALRPKPRYGN